MTEKHLEVLECPVCGKKYFFGHYFEHTQVNHTDIQDEGKFHFEGKDKELLDINPSER